MGPTKVSHAAFRQMVHFERLRLAFMSKITDEAVPETSVIEASLRDKLQADGMVIEPAQGAEK